MEYLPTVTDAYLKEKQNDDFDQVPILRFITLFRHSIFVFCAYD